MWAEHIRINLQGVAKRLAWLSVYWWPLLRPPLAWVRSQEYLWYLAATLTVTCREVI